MTGTVDGEGGNDSLTMTNGTIGSMLGGTGEDTIHIQGGVVNANVEGGGDNDIINLSANADVDGDVTGDGGDDFILIGGAGVIVTGDVTGGTDNDTVTLTLGQLGGDVLMGDGTDDLVVGQAFLLSGTSTLDGGAGAGDSVRIEVADGGSRSFADDTNPITAFENVLFQNDTDPDAVGDVILTSNSTGFVIDTGSTGGGTSVQFLQPGTITFANGGGGSGNMIRAQTVTFGSGTIVTGEGTIDGSATFGGAVAPGGFNTIGTINVSGSVTFGSGATYAADLNNGGLSDLMIAGGTATLNGADLVINFLGDASLLMAGDEFTVIDAGGPIAGSMNLIVAPNAILSSGLEWDVFVDTVTFDVLVRVVTAVSVPEPATTAAFGAGAASLLAMRKQRRRRRKHKHG